MCQKTEQFITTAVRTSNPIYYFTYYSYYVKTQKEQQTMRASEKIILRKTSEPKKHNLKGTTAWRNEKIQN
jgi:hypothetical protein